MKKILWLILFLTSINVFNAVHASTNLTLPSGEVINVQDNPGDWWITTIQNWAYQNSQELFQAVYSAANSDHGNGVVPWGTLTSTSVACANWVSMSIVPQTPPAPPAPPWSVWTWPKRNRSWTLAMAWASLASRSPPPFSLRLATTQRFRSWRKIGKTRSWWPTSWSRQLHDGPLWNGTGLATPTATWSIRTQSGSMPCWTSGSFTTPSTRSLWGRSCCFVRRETPLHPRRLALRRWCWILRRLCRTMRRLSQPAERATNDWGCADMGLGAATERPDAGERIGRDHWSGYECSFHDGRCAGRQRDGACWVSAGNRSCDGSFP